MSALHKHKAKIIKEASGTDDEDALVTKVCSVPAEESTEADKMRLVKIWARTVISKVRVPRSVVRRRRTPSVPY